MEPIKAGFFMGLFCIGMGTIGTFFGLPFSLAWMLVGAGMLFFLSGFAFAPAH